MAESFPQYNFSKQNQCHDLFLVTKFSTYSHRKEINQKSDSRENLSPFRQCACPKIRHQYTILMPSWQVPLALQDLKATFAGYER